MQRHDLDLVSLVPGVLFTAVGLVFLIGHIDVARLDPRWGLPVLAIVVGLLVLLQTVRSVGDDER